MACEFFLGVHRPNWLELSARPLFVSHRVLSPRRRLPRASCDWALDSGGFSELSMFGAWQTSPRDYAAAVRRYRDEIGRLRFASQQDWMCEPHMVQNTGLSVQRHQELSIDNYLELCSLAPDLPWMLAIQGWTMRDYFDHVEACERRGIDLAKLPRVGVGSVCRRKNVVKAAFVINTLAEDYGLRLHAFGVKAEILKLSAHNLASSDSMAWSFAARRENREVGPLLEGRKTGSQNRLSTALEWFDERIAPLLERVQEAA